jgi:hypothetical protein
MAVALAAMATARVSAQTQPQIRVTPEDARLSAYLHELANPGALAGLAAGVAGGAVLERLRHQDRTDLTNELAFGATQRLVGVSLRHGLAAAMHVGTKYQYHLCGCRGFGPRVAHALVETFTDRRDDGGRSVAAPRIVASYAESFTGLAWKHDRSVGSVLAGTTLSYGGQALFNLGRELTRIQVHIHRMR